VIQEFRRGRLEDKEKIKQNKRKGKQKIQKRLTEKNNKNKDRGE
jgi:hypothetical protein